MNCLLACLALAAAPPPPDPAWLSFAVDRRARVTWAFRPASVVKFSGQVRAQVRRATYDAYDVVIPKADCRKGQQLEAGMAASAAAAGLKPKRDRAAKAH